MKPTDGFVLAGPVAHVGLDQHPAQPPDGRTRHRYGGGPFAKLKMPPLPEAPGVYLWELDGMITYVGSTRGTLRNRLGSQGYSTISTYNTFARQPGRRNGGQQTNCRVNALANSALADGRRIAIWYQTTEASEAKKVEAAWMDSFGVPEWNLRDERRGLS
ncbi:MAG: hypothetical protein R2706_20735 [Acidimicrobiales bacterium]